jgi:hypothetical protein
LDRQNRPVIDLACYLIAVQMRIDTKKNFLGLCRSGLLLLACSESVEPRVAMKMGRRLRCSSVTYQFKYASSSRLAGGRFDRNAAIPVTDLVHLVPMASPVKGRPARATLTIRFGDRTLPMRADWSIARTHRTIHRTSGRYER